MARRRPILTRCSKLYFVDHGREMGVVTEFGCALKDGLNARHRLNGADFR